MTTKVQLNKTIFDKSTLSLGFYLFLFIIFLRSIVLILPKINIFSLSIFEFFGLFSSYLLLLIILINFRNILWNRTCFLVLVFVSYSFLSILWGSNIKEVSRIALPFIIIFLITFIVTETRAISYIYKIIFLSFIIPIVYSFYSILNRKGDYASDYLSGIERFGGAYQGSHILAYSMLFFIFFVALIIMHDNNIKRYFKLHNFALIVISIFCLYKSSTRTAYVGFFIFILIMALGVSQKQKILTLFLFILFFFTVISSDHFQKIFWKTEDRDYKTASSGRTELWDNNLSIFKKMSFPQKIIGLGLGCEGKFIKEFNKKVEPSHNDYLSILMSLGILGLTIYLLLLITVLYDIFNSNIRHQIKFTFLGILISVMVMNFLSNAVIFRVEFSQYFWMIIGLYYKYEQFTYRCQNE